MYNSRGVHALNVSAAGFQAYTANRQSIWAKLYLGDFNSVIVKRWLEACEKLLYAEFNQTRFYDALGEMNPDMHSIGNGYILTEEDPKTGRILFLCRHPLACYIAENAKGDVDTIHEDVYMTYKAAFDRFGEKLSQAKKAAAKKTPFEFTTIRHVVMPRDERYIKRAERPIHEGMEFLSIWYDSDDNEIIDIGGYWEMPFIVGRYAKNGSEAYGHAPGHYALGDILGAIQMTKSRIKLGQLISDPTLIVPQELEGDDTVLPAGRIYTTRDTQRIEPLILGANYPITVDNEQRQEQAINEHFNVQLYLMLQSATKEMTAREVIERMGEKAAVLSHVTGRYTAEVLQPLVIRTFNLMYRSGRLPPAPPQVAEAVKAGQTLKIEFNGFLAQIQRKYYQSGGVNATIEYTNAIAGLFPESKDLVKGDELMREALETGQTPATVIRDDKELAALRQAKAEAQQQAMQMEQQTMITENVDKLNQPVQPGSILENIGKVAAAQQKQPQGGRR